MTPPMTDDQFTTYLATVGAKPTVVAAAPAAGGVGGFFEKNFAGIAMIALAIMAFNSDIFQRDGNQNVGLARLETTLSGLEETTRQLRIEVRDLQSFTRQPRFTRQDFLTEISPILQSIDRSEERLDDRAAFMQDSRMKDANHDARLTAAEAAIARLEAQTSPKSQ